MNQPQQMNMGGMGGPVGGGAPSQHQMNAGTPSSSGNASDGSDAIKRLNTYIYDYFLRNQQWDVARVMLQSEQLGILTTDKHSPNQRQANGVDDMDTDRPKDLPDTSLAKTEGPFLQDWWFQFWDIFQARRTASAKPSTLNYIGNQRGAQKARSNMMGMDPLQQQNMRNMQMMNSGMMSGDLKKTAMQNSGNMHPAQFAQMQRMRQTGQMMPGQQMERSGSQMDMSGPRSNSPGSGDAPSPKRQRLEGNMQMAQRPGAQGQIPNPQVGPEYPSLDPAAANRTRELLEEHKVDVTNMPPEQFVSLALQPTDNQRKSVEVYSQQMQAQMKQALNNSNMTKGMPPNAVGAMGPGGAQGSPMSQAQIDGTMAEYGPNGMRPSAMPNPGVAGANNANGNHALQDYQMQLMLLEQQNKKRLLMARQEQDSMTHPGMPPNGQFASGMSPQGSRAGGPSPNPNDMARGTPKMPSPNGQMGGRGSPAPGFNPSQGMPPGMRGPMVMPNGQMNPRSHPQFANQLTAEQLQEFNRQTGGQMMPNGTFGGPGGPQQMPPGMMPGQMNPAMQQPGQGPPNMTPRQGNAAMPPPPAPQPNATGGTQPSSPAPAAPPTPSQQNKPKPGGKKDQKSNKKASNKKGSNQTGATSVSESEQPPTPTPATPITPMNTNSFHAKQNMQNGASAAPQQQQQQQQQQNAIQPPPPQDMPFGNGLDGNQFDMNMDFADLGTGGDVLDNFDFDSFLNTEDTGGLGFDPNFGFGEGGLEAGGEGMPQ